MCACVGNESNIFRRRASAYGKVYTHTHIILLPSIDWVYHVQKITVVRGTYITKINFSSNIKLILHDSSHNLTSIQYAHLYRFVVGILYTHS